MYFNFIKREGLMLSPARNRSRAAGGPVPSFGVAPTQPVPSGRFPTTMYEDRTMLSAFSRSLAPARPLRRVLTLTVALALGALPVGASAVVPHPQTAVAAVQPPRNNADTEYNTCVERLVGDASPTPGVWAVCRGYLDEGEYVARRRHDATVTRAELVRLLYRMAGSPAVKDLPAVSPYADVPASDPDYAAIIWAADAGITAGWDDGLFHPDDRASRYTLSAFLYRTAGSPEGAATIRRPKLVERDAQRKEDAAARKSRFATESRWLTRTLGEYPAADRDGDGVTDKVKPGDPLYFSDALYMLRAYEKAGLKVVGTPAGN